MSTTTENLNLFKYNTATDGAMEFSITNALNNNWDKVDKVSTSQLIETINSGTISLNNKSIYKITPSAATAFTFNTAGLGLTSSSSYTFELCINMSTVYALTFPTISWQDEEEPDFSSEGIYLLAFRTIDGGSTWLGNLQGVF